MAEEKNKHKPSEKKESNNPFRNLTGGGGDKPKFNFYWIYGIIALAFIILQFMASSGSESSDRSIQKGQLINMLKRQDVEKIVVVNKDEYAEIYVKSEKSGDYPALKKGDSFMDVGQPYLVYNGDLENFGELIQKVQDDEQISDESKVYITRESRVDYTSQIFSWLLPIGLMVVLWIFIMRRMGGGAGGGVWGAALPHAHAGHAPDYAEKSPL